MSCDASERSQAEFDAAVLANTLLRRNPILWQKICYAVGCVSRDVPNALREVLRFMFLVAHHDAGQLTPSHQVDLAWHEFILCTKAYQDFCNTQFGRMIHHFPGGPHEVHRRQFEITLQQYERYFGKPERRYWGNRLGSETFDCGACEAFS